MKVIIAENYEDGAKKAADIIERIVRDNPECTLGLATGSSPVGMYRELARRCKAGELSFRNVEVVSIDEYYPSSPDALQSRGNPVSIRIWDGWRHEVQNEPPIKAQVEEELIAYMESCIDRNERKEEETL